MTCYHPHWFACEWEFIEQVQIPSFFCFLTKSLVESNVCRNQTFINHPHQPTFTTSKASKWANGWALHRMSEDKRVAAADLSHLHSNTEWQNVARGRLLWFNTCDECAHYVAAWQRRNSVTGTSALEGDRSLSNCGHTSQENRAACWFISFHNSNQFWLRLKVFFFPY